jgi:hypothetical protein
LIVPRRIERPPHGEDMHNAVNAARIHRILQDFRRNRHCSAPAPQCVPLICDSNDADTT